MNYLVLCMRWSHRRTECAFIVTFAVIVTTVLYFAGRINQTWKTITRAKQILLELKKSDAVTSEKTCGFLFNKGKMW